MIVPEAIRRAAGGHRHPLLFATISGAHLYGFPSPDSDWDLRGCHVLPSREFLGLRPPRDETITVTRVEDDVELDLVTHDLRKFLALLARANGYVLEQVLSPLVVTSSEEHRELCALARRCVTSNHARHYLGFARSQWQLLERGTPPRVKPLLYVYRVLLTGLHLVRTGDLVCDLGTLLLARRFDDVAALVECKRAGHEDLPLANAELARHRQRFDALCAELLVARGESPLPARHELEPELDAFLRRVRAARG